MLMLSNLKNFKIVDENNRSANLTDLSVSLDNVDYPPVTKVFFLNALRQLVFFDWENVQKVNPQKREILIHNLDDGVLIEENALDKQVLLRRDINDALILDLRNRRATRANDLWLELENDKLILRGADATAGAILRRIFGSFTKPKPENMFDWRYLEFLRGDPQAIRNGAFYHSRIVRLPPGEIAQFVETIPYLHAVELIILLPDNLAARVLELISPEKQLQIFEELDGAQSLKMLSLLASESATNVLKQLAPQKAKKLLEDLPKPKSLKIIELLHYAEGTVGSIMTNNVVFLQSNITVAEAREQLSERMNEANFVYLIYTVTDEKSRRLDGLLSLRNIIAANAEDKLSDIHDSYVTVLHPLEEAAVASFRVIDSHLAAMPVTNQEGKLLGVLTIDAAVSAVAPRAWRDVAPRIFS